MKDEIWKIFELTGNIDSYLYYKSKINYKEYDEQRVHNIIEATTIE